jgi:hypothetical protein
MSPAARDEMIDVVAVRECSAKALVTNGVKFPIIPDAKAMMK